MPFSRDGPEQNLQHLRATPAIHRMDGDIAASRLHMDSVHSPHCHASSQSAPPSLRICSLYTLKHSGLLCNIPHKLHNWILSHIQLYDNIYNSVSGSRVWIFNIVNTQGTCPPPFVVDVPLEEVNVCGRSIAYTYEHNHIEQLVLAVSFRLSVSIISFWQVI